MKNIWCFIAFAIVIIAGNVKANNIQVSNVSISGQNTVIKFTLISFDVKWDNSWRTIRNEANYDGAWIFVKFRKGPNSAWQHATINHFGGVVPAGSLMQTSLDGKGVWIYHAPLAVDFTGNVNYTGAKIRWNYGVDGVLDTEDVEVRVFGLEMVYIPRGPFKLGSGGTEYNHFYSAGSNNPYTVSSENAITVSSLTGLYYTNYSAAISGGDQAGPIPAAFPKGFDAIWIMKYECSQGQYASFLNNLDATKAANRKPHVNAGFSSAFPNINAPYPERAMNYVSINDYLAFADWACLRPFTELEYEKVCRGASQEAVPNEYPWGTTYYAPISGTPIRVYNQGMANESVDNGNVNINYWSDLEVAYVGLFRPTRTGIFATANSTRQSSGGAYYGVLDLAYNVEEICITAGTPHGRSFTAVNGDGRLTAAGYADNFTWFPLGVLSGGFSLKGGYYNGGNGRTSHRSLNGNN